MGKKLLSILLALTLCLSLAVPALAAEETEDVLDAFTDVDADDENADAIRWAITNNVMNGYGKGKLAPEDSTSRAMLVTMLWRMEGCPAPTTESVFSDVNEGDWYAEPVLWAYEKGLVTGYTNGAFAPADAVTVEQLAAILYRYAEMKEATGSPAWMYLLDCEDADEVSDYAFEAVHWMAKEEVIVAEDGRLDPTGEASRGDVAAILCRFDALDTPEPETTKPIPLIIDADVGNSTDDSFALEIAYRLMDVDYVDLIGVVVSRIGEGYPDLADIYNTYYGYGDIPIGVEREGITTSKVYIDQRPLDELTNEDGTKMFARTDVDFSDNLTGCELYRKLLSEAEDHSVKIVVIGFVSAVVALMESGPDEYSDLTGLELIRQKVDSMYFMGTKLGSETENGLGYNLKYDLELAKKYFALWPSEVPVYISSSPVGDALWYAPEQILADSSWDETSPIYQTHKEFWWDPNQRMWDPLCVINAAFPEVFEYSVTGNVIVNDDKTISFEESEDGAFRYQILGDETWCGEILAYIRYYTMMES